MFLPVNIVSYFYKKDKKIDRYLLWKVLNGNFVRRFYQLKNNNWWVFVLYNIQYFDSYILIKKFVWCILLKTNQIQNEQALQWLGSCFLIGGSRVQLPSVPFFKTWFKLKAKQKKKRRTGSTHNSAESPVFTEFDRFCPVLAEPTAWPIQRYARTGLPTNSRFDRSDRPVRAEFQNYAD